MIIKYFSNIFILFCICTIGCEQPKNSTDKPTEEPKQIQTQLRHSDLAEKSLPELRVMRNEIFARHGYKFKSADLNEYFSNQPWYKPQFDDVTNMLTDIDKRNIAIIKSLEEQLEKDEEEKNDRLILSDSVFKIYHDYVIIPSFEIQLNLSNKAEEKLLSSNETVIVDAFFSGIPKDKTDQHYQEWGEISIGEHAIELDTQRIAVFDNAKIDREKFELLDSKNFQILVNVYSGRKSSHLNILDVDIIQDSVNVVMGKRHVLNGKLIGE